mgnify:CR=1 FL=1
MNKNNNEQRREEVSKMLSTMGISLVEESMKTEDLNIFNKYLHLEKIEDGLISNEKGINFQDNVTIPEGCTPSEDSLNFLEDSFKNEKI